MPQLKFNHRKRPGDGANKPVRKALWHRIAAAAGVVAIAAAGIGAIAMTAQADPHPVQKDTVADNSTLGNWSGAVGIEDTTENVGRIWTDKTVQNEDVTLSGECRPIGQYREGQLRLPRGALRSLLHVEHHDDVHHSPGHRARARHVRLHVR